MLLMSLLPQEQHLNLDALIVSAISITWFPQRQRFFIIRALRHLIQIIPAYRTLPVLHVLHFAMFFTTS